ncbi:RDD family protein [Streptomyces sp. NPDC046977]|uniref:RDD family protein n=1 Tax=Streptomyces sp. NPDC046977 TaxID=3154703 RepID=UPI0033C2C69B
MSSNQPPGYGYPQGGSGGQDPYGQNPYGQQPHPQGQNPYDQQQPPPFPQQPGSPYGYPQAPPAGYGQMPVDPALAGMPPLADSGQRFLARLIDGLILIPVVVVVFAVVGFSGGFGKTFLASVLLSVAIFLYEALMLRTSGQTVGKKVMKIRVARLADGAVPGDAAWTRAGVYAGLGVVSNLIPCLGAIPSLLNALWHLWDKPYRQCWHDKAAKTVVVKV